MRKRFFPRVFVTVDEEEVVTKKRFDVDHLKQISLITEGVDVVIQTHDAPGIDLVFTTFEGGPEMEVDQVDGRLDVDVFDQRRIQINLFSTDRSTASLVLQVPPAIADIWEVEASSKRVNVGPIQPKAFYGKVGSGTFECHELRAEIIDLKVSSGKLTCGMLEADDLTVYVSSGKARIEHAIGQKMDVEFTSGHLEIENVVGTMFKGRGSSGKGMYKNVTVDSFEQKCSSGTFKINRINTVSMEASVTSGRMEIDRVTSNSIDVQTTSGRVDLRLDEEQQDWRLELDVSSGRIEAPPQMKKVFSSDKRVEGIIGEGKNKLYAKASSGSIKIR